MAPSELGLMAPGWYLQRAVPWPVVLGGVGLGALPVAAGHRWDSLTGPVLPLVVVLAAAGAAFVHDEPAVAVTCVTPRGGRWAPALRSVAGVLPLLVGLGLLLLAPGELSAGSWGLVVLGLGSLVLMLTLLASSRQRPRPGSAVAGTVVVLGLVPLTMGPFLDLPAVYPSPGLSDTMTTLWAGAAVVGLVGMVGLVGLTCLRRPRSTE